MTAPEEAQSWEDFHREIDKLLDEHRPGRAGAGERDWREPIYGWARNHIPDESHLVRHFAQRVVDGREGLATKRANKILRRWAHGEAPLSWDMLGPLPIRVGGLRIRLDVATPEDIEDAARELHVDGLRTYNEVMQLTECMRDLAREARRAGLGVVAQLGNQPPRTDGDLFTDSRVENDDEDEDEDSFGEEEDPVSSAPYADH